VSARLATRLQAFSSKTGEASVKVAVDPERSDDSPDSRRSRVTERTLTAPPVGADRLSVSRQPSSAKPSHLG
jgi:hypothetical protein